MTTFPSIYGGCFEGGVTYRLSHGRYCPVVSVISASPSWRPPAMVYMSNDHVYLPFFPCRINWSTERIPISTRWRYIAVFGWWWMSICSEWWWMSSKQHSRLISRMRWNLSEALRSCRWIEWDYLHCIFPLNKSSAMTMTTTKEQLYCPGHHVAHDACAL